MRTWLPKAASRQEGTLHCPMFRWYSEEEYRPVPGKARYPTAKQARDAADAYLAAALNGPRSVRVGKRREVIETRRARA